MIYTWNWPVLDPLRPHRLLLPHANFDYRPEIYANATKPLKTISDIVMKLDLKLNEKSIIYLISYKLIVSLKEIINNNRQ